MKLRPRQGEGKSRKSRETPAQALELEFPKLERVSSKSAQTPKTAVAQYRESELYAPASALFLGTNLGHTARLVVRLVVILVCIVALVVVATGSVKAVHTTNDWIRVPGVLAIGGLLGWAAAGLECDSRARR